MSVGSPVAMTALSNSRAVATTKASTALAEDIRASARRAPARLRDVPHEVEHHDSAIIEEPIDGGVEAWTSANLAKNRSWYSNECAALVRDGHDGARPVLENAPLRSAC
jgi:hypothetical protein